MAEEKTITELYDFLQGHMVIKEELDQKLEQLENRLVTKDYLDRKFSDFRGDLVVLTRKEDHKVARLIEILKDKKILEEEEVKELFSMEPFPKLAL